MKPLGPEREHYWLALSMAQSTGLDMQAEIDKGTFSSEGWSDLVTRCRGCQWVEGCQRWLQSERQSDHLTADPPQQCPNAKVFETLRADPALIDQDV